MWQKKVPEVASGKLNAKIFFPDGKFITFGWLVIQSLEAMELFLVSVFKLAWNMERQHYHKTFVTYIFRFIRDIDKKNPAWSWYNCEEINSILPCKGYLKYSV